MAETVNFVKMLEENEFEITDPSTDKTRRKFRLSKTDIIRLVFLVAFVILISLTVSYITTVLMHSGKI